MMEKVRFGIVGFGNMGSSHVKNLFEGKVANAVVTAVCDINPEKLNAVKEKYGDAIKLFDNHIDMYNSNEIDAVLVATPHYSHPSLSISAFELNLNVLCEKPAGVYTKQVREMNEAAEKTDKVFGIMYNQRTNPVYQKVRQLIKDGELGEIRRLNWIITTWYRPQSYYDSGTWRATWEGEGGGVLLNQDPHQLDLWQWVMGDVMPLRVRSFCAYGKMHNIEVEDDVTAYAEYENGATAVFITSTYETPGTNRLEITGDMGKIVAEDNKITFWRNVVSERKFNEEHKGGFGNPECWKCEIPVKGTQTDHVGIMENFSNAILKGTPLLAPGVEGIRGLEISNAIHLSSWLDNWVTLPIDEDLFYEKLQEKINNSTVKKSEVSVTLDVSGTH